MFKLREFLMDGKKLRNNKGQLTNSNCYKSNYKTIKALIFEEFVNIINNKNQTKYLLLSTEVINCTNEQDGQTMSLYTDGKKLFVRENIETSLKFTEEE